MRVHYKGITIILLTIVLVMSLATGVKADTQTGWSAGPELKLMRWVSGSTYSLTPGGTGYPQGRKSYVFFHGYGYLPATFAKDNNRALEVFLMEKDGWFNPDDTVKLYTGTFSGLKLSSMKLSVSVTNGDLDNDKTAEMYIDCKVYKTRNPNLSDPAEGTLIGKLFNYVIGIQSN